MKQKNHSIKAFFVKCFGNEKYQSITIPLFAIFISLLAGAVIIGLLGKNPLSAYQNLLQGSGLLPKPSYAGYKNILTDFTSFLNAWTPMLFASLAVAVALKAGLFNIGVSGQMLTAGFFCYFIDWLQRPSGTHCKTSCVNSWYDCRRLCRRTDWLFKISF